LCALCKAESAGGGVAEQSQIATADEFGLLCPNCGYDLRANPGERCSECGQVIDRSGLTPSAIPWVHRRRIGRVRAYLKTVWLVTIDSRHLRGQAAEILKLVDAHSFRRITSTLLALALVGVFVFIADDLAVVISEYRLNISSVNQLGHWSHDLIVPWLAGITLPAVLPVMLVGLALGLTWTQHRLFRTEEAMRRESAIALSCYAAGPMAWWLPILSLECGAQFLDSIGVVKHRVGAVLIMILVPTIALLMIVVRITIWALRVKRKGTEWALIYVPALAGLWLWSAIVWLGILPLIIGFVWIVIDSFR
jgi:hypothetical protein